MDIVATIPAPLSPILNSHGGVDCEWGGFQLRVQRRASSQCCAAPGLRAITSEMCAANLAVLIGNPDIVTYNNTLS